MPISFKAYLNEGVNDPAIFKAVFLAGGPGSGKSFIVGKTALTALGFKLINSDPAFEVMLKKADLKPTPETIASETGQEIRAKAKALIGKKLKLALDGRLGLVIDGTGKDYNSIHTQATELKALGYEVMMLFVNTNAETALLRNRKRSRSLPDDLVRDMWNDVQKNIGKFQLLFGSNMLIIDNSDEADYKKATLSAYRKIADWVKIKPNRPEAKRWIAANYRK